MCGRGACLMLIRLDLTFFTFFRHCACAGRLHFPVCIAAKYAVRPIDFDVDVNNVNPDLRTTCANDVKNSNLAAGTAILNIVIPPHRWNNFRWPIAYGNDVTRRCRPGVRS